MQIDLEGIERLVKEALSLGRSTLVEPEVNEVLKLASIPVPNYQVVKDVNVAMEVGEAMGYPLVLKIISPNIPHKSDVGGVKTGLMSSKDIEDAWSGMILHIADEIPMALIEGFIIEEEVERGTEVIIGAVKDKQFGVTAMFGTGGVAVELMKDVSFALAPLDKEGALEMMKEVKGYPLLTGYRGDTRKDLDAVAEVLVKLTKIVEGTDGLSELEINPLVVYEKGVVAVDARAALHIEQ
ncbi:MAG: acetate--CoA ligase family protein [Thermodesulfobacteriota bacterium]|nr:MAG: acetate--CoA ligase family protein [Thermodesulfobacteriota bacterium]